MNISIQKLLKQYILICLADGKQKSIDEIRTFIIDQKIDFNISSSALRTALFYLKQENPKVKNPQKGIYYLDLDTEASDSTSSDEGSNTTYDFTDFDTIQPLSHKKVPYTISIMADGTLTISSQLRRFYPNHKVTIRLKNDGSQLAITTEATNAIDFGKNGRFKNYDILDRLKKLNKRFPIYYIGTEDPDNGIWIGKLSNNNPNKSRRTKSSSS